MSKNYTIKKQFKIVMKKLLLLSLITLSTSLLSCGNNSGKVDTSKICIDYGHIRDTNLSQSDLKDLTYKQLDSLVTNKESFILITENGVDDNSCGCWSGFKPLLVDFSNKHNFEFYYFNVAALEGQTTDFGIYDVPVQLPGICFFKRGKLIRQTIYGKTSENARRMFSNYDLFEQFMFENIYLPKMYYIDRSKLDALKEEEGKEFPLYVARKTCGDCLNIQKNYLYSWSDNLKGHYDKTLYIFDFDIYRGTEVYQSEKDAFGLSEAGNEKFGFLEGVFPTFQYIKSGEIYDMISVLNDTVTKTEENTFILSSYFNEHRVNNSPLLSANPNYILDGTTVDPKYVNESEGKVWLTSEGKFALHKEIVEVFINNYVI